MIKDNPIPNQFELDFHPHVDVNKSPLMASLERMGKQWNDDIHISVDSFMSSFALAALLEKKGEMSLLDYYFLKPKEFEQLRRSFINEEYGHAARFLKAVFKHLPDLQFHETDLDKKYKKITSELKKQIKDRPQKIQDIIEEYWKPIRKKMKSESLKIRRLTKLGHWLNAIETSN